MACQALSNSISSRSSSRKSRICWGSLSNLSISDTLGSGGDRLTVLLIADFPDYVAEFRPDFPANVRASNPFGVAATDGWLYVVDASLNEVKRVNLTTGASSTFVSLPPVPNTRPFGPPFAEAVPDSIHLSGDQLLV